MSNHQEVSKLLSKLSDNTSKVHARYEHYLLPDIDVAPYEKARAYPGQTFILMGNSFNLEEDHDSSKRTTVLASLFSKQNEPCLKLSDALKLKALNEVLSRFERDWLGRLPADTQIGPAFDINGTEISEAFAVWRSVKTVLNSSRTLSSF